MSSSSGPAPAPGGAGPGGVFLSGVGRAGLMNPAGSKSLIVFVVLALAWAVGFASRLFAVIRFESIIHEFDPWFNYRSTAYMVKHGFYDFLNWFDERAWYPLGGWSAAIEHLFFFFSGNAVLLISEIAFQGGSSAGPCTPG